MSWIPIPNKHDGDGYTLTLAQENGPALFGAWMALIQVASKCDPRGTLLRDTQKPHDSTSISRLTRFPLLLIEEALNFFSSDDMKWLEVLEIEQDAKDIKNGSIIPHLPATLEPHEIDAFRKERKEEKEGAGKADAARDRAAYLSLMPERLRNDVRVLESWARFVKDKADRGKPVNANSARAIFLEIEDEGWSLEETASSFQNAVKSTHSRPFRPDRPKNKTVAARNGHEVASAKDSP
jgi:hypothetical protein